MIVQWKIIGMKSVSGLLDKQDVVIQVDCQINASDGKNEQSMVAPFYVKLIGDEFIPYEKLTEKQVLQWVKIQHSDECDLAEKTLTERIKNKNGAANALTAKPLPWAN